jgi:hypothetical protein
MTKIVLGNMIALQVITSPVLAGQTHHRVIRRVRELEKSIAEGISLGVVINGYPAIPHLLLFLIFSPLWILVMGLKFLILIPAFREKGVWKIGL